MIAAELVHRAAGGRPGDRTAAGRVLPFLLVGGLVGGCGIASNPPAAFPSMPLTTPLVSQSPHESPLRAPEAIAIDASGRVYFTDFEARQVYRIERDGSLTLIAGTGESGSSGDGGPATAATLREPGGIAIDSEGNIYIAEHHGHRIRRVDQNGTITTFAGIGTITVPGTGGLHMGSEGAFSGDGGPATAAELSAPLGLASSHGILYIADAFNGRIRAVDGTGRISTVAGSGRAFSSLSADPEGLPATSIDLSQPWSVAVDRDGSLLVTDWTRFVIYRIDSAGIAHLILGNGAAGFGGDGGPALAAQTEGPYGIAVGPKGDIYFSEVGPSAGGNRIRRIGTDGVVTTIAGTGVAGYSGDGGPAVDAELNGPYGLTVDANGNLYVADGGNHVVRMIGTDGIITTVAGG